MNEVENDIKKALEICRCPLDDGYNDMTEYNRIYQNTTENIKGYMPYLNGEYKTALLPTSSADHTLEAVLNGIYDITCFDINRLSKYYSQLKIEMIKSLSIEDYISFMYEDVFNKDIFDSVKVNLDDATRYFFEELYDNTYREYIGSSLFRYLGLVDYNTGKIKIAGKDFSKYAALNFTSYLDKDNYYKLQGALDKLNVEYITADLVDLKDLLDKKYDLINLTNIYEFINAQMNTEGALEFVSSFNSLIPFLNEKGKILITYFYKTSIADIEKYKKKKASYGKNMYNLLNNDMFSIPIRKKFKDNLYSFRNALLFKYLDDSRTLLYELEATGMGFGVRNKDMAVVYKK